MAWTEHTPSKEQLKNGAEKAYNLADKGLDVADGVLGVVSAIKWVCIAFCLACVLWIGNKAVNALQATAEAVNTGIETTSAAASAVKDSTVNSAKAIAQTSKDTYVAVVESETYHAAKTQVADVQEDITSSQEYKDAKAKAGEVLSAKMNSWFKKEPETVEETVTE